MRKANISLGFDHYRAKLPSSEACGTKKALFALNNREKELPPLTKTGTNARRVDRMFNTSLSSFHSV
jgi:hypothetical protein